MLKIRYNKITGKVSGWNGDPKQAKCLKVRAGYNEAVKTLNIPIPEHSCSNYSLIGNKLVLHLDLKPHVGRNIHELEARIRVLENR